MLKKKFFIVALIALLGILIWNIYSVPFIKSDKMLIKHFFGVNKTDYEIVNIDNTLSNSQYTGEYKVKIRVKEDNIKYFIKEIEKTVSESPLSEDIKSHEMYSDLFKDITGRELKSNDTIYQKFSSVRRIIINDLGNRPKTVYTYVMYSEAVDGIYEIDLVYTEG